MNSSTSEWFRELDHGTIFQIQDLVSAFSMTERESLSIVLGFLSDRKITVVCRDNPEKEWRDHSLALCSILSEQPGVFVGFRKI